MNCEGKLDRVVNLVDLINVDCLMTFLAVQLIEIFFICLKYLSPVAHTVCLAAVPLLKEPLLVLATFYRVIMQRCGNTKCYSSQRSNLTDIAIVAGYMPHLEQAPVIIKTSLETIRYPDIIRPPCALSVMTDTRTYYTLVGLLAHLSHVLQEIALPHTLLTYTLITMYYDACIHTVEWWNPLK